ncbi:MAG TPA: hypothetical protein VE869_03500 [Gemmatimonas sp.]|nr:hypothetical protein [Gemmatimonas sp.]
MKLDSGEGVANRWIGDQARNGVPAVAADATQSATGSEPPLTATSTSRSNSAQRSPFRVGARLLRDACIGLLMLAAVPFAVVQFDATQPNWTWSSTMQEQLADLERLRALMPARDPSVTPTQAGKLFHEMSAARPSSKPRRRELQLFAVRDAAAGTLSQEEERHLEAVAAASVWADFDMVASAPRVDVIGGQYVLPFRTDAFAPFMPSTRGADIKALANAGVSRAAHYVVIGELARAEAALQSVVGYGFMMIDNGTNALDAIVGQKVVDIGRDGLHQLYAITGNARGLALSQPLPKRTSRLGAASGGNSGREADGDVGPAALIADVRNTRLPATLRYESLGLIPFGTCSSIRGMLLGTSEEERATFDAARSSIARFPSEQAYVTLLEESMVRMPAGDSGANVSLSERLAIGAATVVGTVLQNPRIVACTRAAIMFR